MSIGNINKPVFSLENQAWLEQTYDKPVVKMEAECVRVGAMIPYSICDGKYHDLDVPGGIHSWTNGFWTRMLWQIYGAAGDEIYRKVMEDTEERLAEILVSFSGPDHDVGLLFLPSSVANYRKTGSQEAGIRGLKVAQILVGGYNSAGQFIWVRNNGGAMEKAIGGTVPIGGWMIISRIINTPLLYWASKEAGTPRFTGIVLNHARATQQYIARVDGSCNHIVASDPDTKEFLDNPGGWGFERDSSWSQEQSWTVYGFSLNYHHIRDVSLLDTAKECAHYCVPDIAITDWLPLVDYRAPLGPIEYDTAAGMITTCGLLESAEHIGEYEKRLYVEVALRMLRACDVRFANWSPDENFIMGGGTFFHHDPDGSNTEVPIIYGNYYLIEAILRLRGKSLFLW